MNKAKRKITVQVLDMFAGRLNELAVRACLNRDAYLDAVLRFQAQMLLEDAGGHSNSDEAKSFVKRCFAELKDFRVITLNISAETADAIDDACTRVNTWRDIFINRALFMLVVKTSAACRHLHIQSPESYEAVMEAIREDAPGLYVGPRLAALASFVHDDPFSSLRIARLAEDPEGGGNLYKVIFGHPHEIDPKKRGLVGLNPLIEDEYVPTTAAAKERQKLISDLLDEFDVKESKK